MTGSILLTRGRKIIQFFSNCNVLSSTHVRSTFFNSTNGSSIGRGNKIDSLNSSIHLKCPREFVNKEFYSAVFKANSNNMKSLTNKYNDLLSKAHIGGGEKGIHRHVNLNKKILVRERIKALLDENSEFLEIGTIAGHDMPYGNIPCAGAVIGIGKIHGIWCMISANDATVKSGSIFPITLKKQLRAQAIAEENFLPIIYLVDSGGAFLPLQAEIFNSGGKVFYNEAIMSSKGIPQIALVCGSCTAGGAYVPTMAEEAIIIDKIGTIFLGGPPLVRAATGENVTPEELGGATLHCEISGCTDHFVENEQEGIETVRNAIATSNFRGIETKYLHEKPSDMGKFAASCVENTVNVYDIIENLADDGGFHEYKRRYGKALVAGFMFMNGCLVGVLANNGYLTEKAATKGANFVQLCGSRQIPLLFLQNMTFDDSLQMPKMQTASTIKTRAQMLQAIVLCQALKIVISIGGLVGSPHMHQMCSLSMGARFHFVWPNVQNGSKFLSNMNESEISDGGKFTYSDYEKLKQKSTSFYGASQMWYDGVILPQNTRRVVYQCLNIFNQECSNRMKTKQVLRKDLHTVIRM